MIVRSLAHLVAHTYDGTERSRQELIEFVNRRHSNISFDLKVIPDWGYVFYAYILKPGVRGPTQVIVAPGDTVVQLDSNTFALLSADEFFKQYEVVG